MSVAREGCRSHPGGSCSLLRYCWVRGCCNCPAGNLAVLMLTLQLPAMALGSLIGWYIQQEKVSGCSHAADAGAAADETCCRRTGAPAVVVIGAMSAAAAAAAVGRVDVCHLQEHPAHAALCCGALLEAAVLSVSGLGLLGARRHAPVHAAARSESGAGQPAVAYRRECCHC